jgi:D-arabinose 1-dehydrogenase-like Zn-dependent alcohol dehydrogenase
VIDVKATGVNYADAIMVAGRYQTRPAFPFSPGLEAAGTVARCGTGVTRFNPGDRVMAILAYGGFAEQAAALEGETFAMPGTMPFDEAGAFPVTYVSSHLALRWQARLEAGETLVVLGAAGGVGLAAVRRARRLVPPARPRLDRLRRAWHDPPHAGAATMVSPSGGAVFRASDDVLTSPVCVNRVDPSVSAICPVSE